MGRTLGSLTGIFTCLFLFECRRFVPFPRGSNAYWILSVWMHLPVFTCLPVSVPSVSLVGRSLTGLEGSSSSHRCHLRSSPQVNSRQTPRSPRGSLRSCGHISLRGYSRWMGYRFLDSREGTFFTWKEGPSRFRTYHLHRGLFGMGRTRGWSARMFLG